MEVIRVELHLNTQRVNHQVADLRVVCRYRKYGSHYKAYKLYRLEKA